MNEQIESKSSDSGDCSVVDLPIDLAFVRWSVVNQKWSESSGMQAYLPSFLAGWFCRCTGVNQPYSVGKFKESFLAGWSQADSFAVIESRKSNDSLERENDIDSICHWIWNQAEPAHVPSRIHDKVARHLGLPSLAHGFADTDQ